MAYGKGSTNVRFGKYWSLGFRSEPVMSYMQIGGKKGCECS